MNGLPVEKQTFVGADEKTYRGLQYDLLKHIWEGTNIMGDKFTTQPDRCAKRFVPRWFAWAATVFGLCSVIGILILIKVSLNDPAMGSEITNEVLRKMPSP